MAIQPTTAHAYLLEVRGLMAQFCNGDRLDTVQLLAAVDAATMNHAALEQDVDAPRAQKGKTASELDAEVFALSTRIETLRHARTELAALPGAPQLASEAIEFDNRLKGLKVWTNRRPA